MKVFQIVAMTAILLLVIVAPTLSETFPKDQTLSELENCRYCLKGIEVPEIDLLQELLTDQASWELESEVRRQESEELLIELQNVQYEEETLNLFKAFLS